MPIIRMAFLVAVLSAGLVGQAAALSYRDIAGKWCGGTLDYHFSRSLLTVVFRDRTPTRKFKITNYDYFDDKVTVHWIDQQGKKVYTDFSEFSADNSTMAQVRTEVGPRRPFRRCR